MMIATMMLPATMMIAMMFTTSMMIAIAMTIKTMAETTDFDSWITALPNFDEAEGLAMAEKTIKTTAIVMLLLAASMILLTLHVVWQQVEIEELLSDDDKAGERSDGLIVRLLPYRVLKAKARRWFCRRLWRIWFVRFVMHILGEPEKRLEIREDHNRVYSLEFYPWERRKRIYKFGPPETTWQDFQDADPVVWTKQNLELLKASRASRGRPVQFGSWFVQMAGADLEAFFRNVRVVDDDTILDDEQGGRPLDIGENEFGPEFYKKTGLTDDEEAEEELEDEASDGDEEEDEASDGSDEEEEEEEDDGDEASDGDEEEEEDEASGDSDEEEEEDDGNDASDGDEEEEEDEASGDSDEEEEEDDGNEASDGDEEEEEDDDDEASGESDEEEEEDDQTDTWKPIETLQGDRALERIRQNKHKPLPSALLAKKQKARFTRFVLNAFVIIALIWAVQKYGASSQFIVGLRQQLQMATGTAGGDPFGTQENAAGEVGAGGVEGRHGGGSNAGIMTTE